MSDVCEEVCACVKRVGVVCGKSTRKKKSKANPKAILMELKSLETIQSPLFRKSLSRAQRLGSSCRRDVCLFPCRKTEKKCFMFKLLNDFKAIREAEVSRVSF